jgi:hypothetical protein
MIGRIALLALLFALGGCQQASDGPVGPPAMPPLSQLRLALVMPGARPDPGADCPTDAPEWPAAQRAYVRHLAERMEVPVRVCAVASTADAARALAENRADFAQLDPAGFAPFKAALRPILTPRTPTDLGRTEVVLAVAAASTLRKLEDADHAALLFAGSSPPQWDGPRRTLASAGVPAAVLSGARVMASPAEAAAALMQAPGAAAAFLSADWSRLCRGTARDDRPCEGLREIWRGRPQAATAWAVRRDISPESWVRLVGIHVALFLEKPDVATWLAPGTNEIEPTEATALDPARAGQ